MSDLNAIATITAALRARLSDVLPDAVAGATASAARPGEVGGAGGLPHVGVNVFLYATRVNVPFRNSDLPTRTARGDAFTRPVAATDLDYLFTFYAPDLIASHRLLGCTLRSFHARPTITPAMINAVEQVAGGIVSGLADQSDPVRITPIDMSIDEMSKLWSILFQVRYVLSAAFRLGPVLIEAALDPIPQPPVRSHAVVTIPLRQPVITDVVATAEANAPIIPGSRIAILGRFDLNQLIGVDIGGQDAGPLLLRQFQRLELVLPANADIGAIGLAVRYDVPLGDPPQPHHGVASTLFALVIVPAIAPLAAPAIVADQVVDTGGGTRSARVQLLLTTPLAPARQIVLLLVDPATEETRQFLGTARAADADPLTFFVTALPAGTYVVQVGVDGALSQPQRDTQQGSPTYRRLIGPTVTVP